MFYLLFSLVFAAVAVLYVLNGMRKGKKYIWSYSVAQIATVLISAISAAFLSAGLSLLAFKALFGAMAAGKGDLGGLLTELPLMAEALTALASMIAAPILFYVIFSILRIVLGIVAKIVLRLIARKIAQKKGELPTEEEAPAEDSIVEDAEPTEVGKKAKKKSKDDGYFRISEQKNPKGMLCGALCGFVLFLATMVPAVGMLGVLNDMTSWGTAGENNPAIQTVASVVDAGANNVGAKVVRAVGGDALYSVMTTYEVGDQKATLAKETKLLGVMGRAMSDMTNKEVARADAAESFRQIDGAFQETTLIPSVLPEFLSASKESWDRGEAYYGIEKPSFDKMDGLVHPILDVLGTSTKQTINEDVATLVDLTAYMIENDAMTEVKEDPMSIFKNQDVTSEVMFQLLENDHLAPLVGDFSEFGLEMFGDALKSPMTEIELDSSNIKNNKEEAEALAVALSEMAIMTEQLKADKFDDLNAIAKMGPMLDALAVTETIGEENTGKILESILISPRISRITNFDYDTSMEWADRINLNAKLVGYKETLEGFCQVLEMGLNFKY